eukprot:Gb_06677 [translate_table: standard]
MGVDRELRSSKRQRIGLTCLDVPPINSQSPHQVAVVERSRDSEYAKRRMPNCMVHRRHSSNDTTKESKSNARKICHENSKKKFGRRKYGILKGNQSNKTNGVLDLMHVSPVKKEVCTKDDDASEELFPEHNGKVVNNLLLLKGMNIAVPEPVPSPALKAKKNQTPVPLVNDVSVAAINCLDVGTCDEKPPSVEGENSIEIKMLDKLKQYIRNRGGTLGPGWKAQITGCYPKQYTYYISPENKKFKSLITVSNHLQNMKCYKGEEKNSGKAESKEGIANVSVCLNMNNSQVETIPGSLAVEKVPKENNEQDMYSRISPKVKGFIRQQGDTASVGAEHGPKQGCMARIADEKETQPLCGSSNLGVKDKNDQEKFRNPNREDPKDNQHRHWIEVLKQVLNSSSMTAGGVRSCICKALASGPPDCAKKLRQHSFTKDASKRSGPVPTKEAVLSVLAWYHSDQLNHGQAERGTSHEKTTSNQGFSKTEKGVFMNESGRKMTSEKVDSSSEVVTERCRKVFLNIISSENFAALCNLIQGNFAGSRMHEVFDFRLIDLRMNAGTYGKSPELFASDMQQLWKNVHKIGQEMVQLADSLSQHSQNSYEIEVATFLEGESAESFKFDMTEKNTLRESLDQEDLDEHSEEIIHHHHGNKQINEFAQSPRVEECNDHSISSLKNLQTNQEIHNVDETPKDANTIPAEETQIIMKVVEDTMNRCLLCEQCDFPSSSTDGSVCRACGVDIHSDCILICDGCEAAYHMYCLKPALEEIPSGSWYCSSCYAAGKESSDADSFRDKNENGLVGEDVENGVYHCVVCERLSKRENIEHNRQAASESRKKAAPNLHTEEFDLDTDKAAMEVHASGQELQLYNDELVNRGFCKVCSIGKKDNDHLIECSNLNCLSKFYHLSCLNPPLETIPPPGWYCPSCLCRVCLVDADDDYIILCDGCDDGYHTYCLSPPLDQIPDGKWYCSFCLQKQRRKKGKKGQRRALSKSTGHVQPENISLENQFSSGNISKLENEFSSGQVRVAQDCSRRTIDHVMEIPVPRVRVKKISSMVTQKLTTSTKSPGETAKLSTGNKTRVTRKRKRNC